MRSTATPNAAAIWSAVDRCTVQPRRSRRSDASGIWWYSAQNVRLPGLTPCSARIWSMDSRAPAPRLERRLAGAVAVAAGLMAPWYSGQLDEKKEGTGLELIGQDVDSAPTMTTNEQASSQQYWNVDVTRTAGNGETESVEVIETWHRTYDSELGATIYARGCRRIGLIAVVTGPHLPESAHYLPSDYTNEDA